MQKSSKFKYALAVGAISMVTIFFFGCKNTNKTVTPLTYDGEFGSVFSIPVQSENYIVYNSNGDLVPVENGELYLFDLNGYTVDVDNQKSAIVITVSDTVAPEIKTEKDVVFAKKGDRISFGKIIATDLQRGEFIPDAKLVNDDTPVDLNNFKPKENGLYDILLSAKDASNNVSYKHVYVEVNDSGDSGYLVAGFGSPYGISQMKTQDGVEISYDTNRSFGSQNGSLKIATKSDKKLFLSKLFKADLRSTSGISFYVYNANEESKTVTIVNEFTVNLFPSEWTEVYLTPSQLAVAQGNDLNEIDSISLENLELSFEKGLTSTSSCEYYLSDISYIRFLDKVTYFYEWLNLVGDIDAKLQSDSDVEAWMELYRIWNSFPTATKDSIRETQSWVFKDRYGDNYKEYYDESFSLRMLEYQATTKNDIQDNQKIIYNDGNLGENQLSSPDNSIKLSYDDAKSCDKISEIGSLKLQIGALDQATLRIDIPLCSKSLEVNNLQNGSSLYSKIYFYAYSDADMECEFQGIEKTIYAGEWTRIEFPVSESLKLQNQMIHFLNGSNKTVYVTSFFAAPDKNTLELQALIDVFLADNNITASNIQENNLLTAIYAKLQTFNETRRVRVQRLDELIRKIGEILDSPTDTNGSIVYQFDKLFGKYQIFASNCTVEYTSDVKYENESGSLKFVVSGQEVWDFGFTPYHLLQPTPPDGQYIKDYVFYVKMEGISNTMQLSSTNVGKLATIYPTNTDWIKVCIDASKLQGDLSTEIIYLHREDWNEVPSSACIYISAINAVYDAIQTQL